jgi:hypothetical protein
MAALKVDMIDGCLMGHTVGWYDGRLEGNCNGCSVGERVGLMVG